MKSQTQDLLDYDILKKDYELSIEDILADSEKFVWNGKPNYVFSLMPLEMGGYDVALGPTNMYFIALAICWFKSYIAFGDSRILVAIIFFLLGLVLFLLPDVVKEIRRRKTAYAVSDRHVFFKLWGLRKKHRIIAKLKLASLVDVRMEEYNDKTGILYFLLKEQPAFKTFDFSSSASRHHPTFENIAEVASLRIRIIELKKELAAKNKI